MVIFRKHILLKIQLNPTGLFQARHNEPQLQLIQVIPHLGKKKKKVAKLIQDFLITQH